MRRWAKRLAVSAIQSHEPRGPRTAVHGVELLGVGGGYGDGEPVGSALFQLPPAPREHEGHTTRPVPACTRIKAAVRVLRLCRGVRHLARHVPLPAHTTDTPTSAVRLRTMVLWCSCTQLD